MENGVIWAFLAIILMIVASAAAGYHMSEKLGELERAVAREAIP